MSYNNQSWQMLCSKEALFARAKLNSIIRDFFKKRNVLEVETPLLARSTVTDPFINSFEVQHSDSVDASDKYYLQTSPEFAMKKMLCSGVGSIYQICKAFRSEEIGRNHNIEFTMLEWYRIGFNLDDLITEMEELLVLVINSFQHADNKFFYRNTRVRMTFLDTVTLRKNRMLRTEVYLRRFLLFGLDYRV